MGGIEKVGQKSSGIKTWEGDESLKSKEIGERPTPNPATEKV